MYLNINIIIQFINNHLYTNLILNFHYQLFFIIFLRDGAYLLGLFLPN